MLRREKALARAVLGEGGRCWFVTPTFEAATDSLREIPEAPGLRLGRAFVATHDDAEVTIWTARVAWRAGAFAPTLRAIADDRLTALWVSQATAEVLAPYAGGVDIIAASPERRAALASKYARWLPRTPSGL